MNVKVIKTYLKPKYAIKYRLRFSSFNVAQSMQIINALLTRMALLIAVCVLQILQIKSLTASNLCHFRVIRRKTTYTYVHCFDRVLSSFRVILKYKRR